MPNKDLFSQKPALVTGRYRHYKGGEYEVLLLACNEATHEWVVVYRALYDTGKSPDVWMRTYENFTEDVETDGQKIPRFTLL